MPFQHLSSAPVPVATLSLHRTLGRETQYGCMCLSFIVTSDTWGRVEQNRSMSLNTIPQLYGTVWNSIPRSMITDSEGKRVSNLTHSFIQPLILLVICSELKWRAKKGFNCLGLTMVLYKPSVKGHIRQRAITRTWIRGNTNQCVHFIRAGSQLVIHYNFPSLYDLINSDAAAAASFLSEVATCLEQLSKEKVTKIEGRR